MADDDWAKVRQTVEKRLSRRIEDQLWVAVLRDYLYGGPGAPTLVEDLVAEFESIRVEARHADQREAPELFVRPRDKASRVKALSSVLAAEAARLPEVRAFRERALRDGLVKPDGCLSWITEHREEPEPHRFVLLAYPSADEQWELRMSVRSDSVLGELAKVGEALANLFGWQEQQATVFVLTGRVPIVAPIRATVDLNMSLPAASRIVLEIDPWTDPRDVQDEYRRVRRQHSGENTRYRPLGERALALATFVAARPDEPDAKRRGAWNRAHKQWAYDDTRAFVRAYRAATSRLLDPKIR